MTHAPSGSRLALVSGKNINPTRFLGTQHKDNKISYTKWKRELTDVVLSKGAAGADLAKAMAWAIGIGKMSQVTDVMIVIWYTTEVIN